MAGEGRQEVSDDTLATILVNFVVSIMAVIAAYNLWGWWGVVFTFCLGIWLRGD